MVTQEHHHRDEERDAERGPDQLGGRRLVLRRLQVEPVDQYEAHAVEQHGDGQQQRIGVRGAEADGEMGE